MMTLIRKETLLVFLLVFPFSFNFGQNLITNGTMELGTVGFQSVPTGWSTVTGTPDHCMSPPSSCPGSTVYRIGTSSPQGSKWVRFFRTSGNNEQFGQTLTTPFNFRTTIYIKVLVCSL